MILGEDIQAGMHRQGQVKRQNVFLLNDVSSHKPKNPVFKKFPKITLFILFALIFGIIIYADFTAMTVSDTVRYAPDNIQLDTSQISDPNAAAQAQTQSMALFDRDTTTLYAPQQASNIQVTFGAPINLRFIKVYGPASYYITVYSFTGTGTWSVVPGLSRIDLSKATQVWNKYQASSPQQASLFKVTLEPISGLQQSGVAEMEFWADGLRMNVRDGATLSSSIDANGVVSYGKKFPAGPQTDTVSVTSNVGGFAIQGAVFYVNVSGQAADFNRAWLIYDLNGITSWLSAQHTINGMGSVSGWPVATGTDWVTQAEPIDPDLLVNGPNVITFTPTTNGMGYSVRNVAVVVETDNGFNQFSCVEVNDTNQQNMLDGDPTTLWQATGAANAIFDIYRPVQADYIGILPATSTKGTLQISGLNDFTGLWEQAAKPVQILPGQQAWSNEATTAGTIYDKIRFDSIISAGGIAEAVICGSGVGKPRIPGIVINYPDAGEYFGRTAYIKGYLPVPGNASGPAQVLLGPDAAEVQNGVFSGMVSKDDVGLEDDDDTAPWSVDVTAIYPDGTKIVKTVTLNSWQASTSQQASLENSISTAGKWTISKSSKTLQVGDIELEVNSSDFDQADKIKIQQVTTDDIAPLEPGMINVTAKYKAYRFLPHHAKFKNKIRMRIPYDIKKLPKYQKESDIKTYYYNDYIKRWLPVECEQVDTQNKVIVSLTDHFTDFINATIVVPDHQQEQDFNPNQIKDLKAALPGAGITMLSPPEVNNQGDAVMNFTADVPPIAQGVKPDVAVTYNSSSGDGLLGYGWDMPIKAVMCDTKFGVPQYDPNNETESYLLDGEPLIPNARRINFEQRVNYQNGKAFFAKIEGKFNRITRKIYINGGYGPNNYYWQVIDKNGTTYTYGYDPNSLNYSRLNADTNGDTYLWALSSIKDKNGNEIDYFYQPYSDSSNISLDHITYGIYTVHFSYGNKSNSRSDGRGGFVRNYTQVLQGIDIRNTYAGTPGFLIRAYYFTYNNPKGGEFGTDLLTSITQFDSNGNTIAGATHTFNYYDDYSNNPTNNKIFSPPTLWNNIKIGTNDTQGLTVPGGFNIPDTNFINKSLVGQSVSTGLGFGFSIDLGLNVQVPCIPGICCSDNGYCVDRSITLLNFSGNWNWTESYGSLRLMDMDGDGIPDLVYTNNMENQFNWSRINPNTMSNSPLDPNYDTFNNNVISHEHQFSQMLGLGVLSCPPPTTIKTKGYAFFTDANGDGIPDLSINGEILFGQRATKNGQPLYDSNNNTVITYTSSSESTEFPVAPSNNIDRSSVSADLAAGYINELTWSPLLDTVKKWDVPYTGTIHIAGTVQVVNNPDIVTYATYDGIRAAIQYDGANTSINNTELWKEAIFMSNNTWDFGPHDPNSPTSMDLNNPYPLPQTINVYAGDRLYFRLQSVYDGKDDEVWWAPLISYTSIPNSTVGQAITTDWTDANYLSQMVYKSHDDFTLAGSRNITFPIPYSGTINIEGDLQKLAAANNITTDNVTLRMKLITTQGGTLPQAITTDLNYADTDPAQTLMWCQGGSIPMGNTGPPEQINGSGAYYYYRQIHVYGGQNGDQLQLFADCDSNIDIHQFQWKPYLHYVQMDDPTLAAKFQNGLPGWYVPYDMMFYPRNIGGILNKPVVIPKPYLQPVQTLNDPNFDNALCQGVFLRLKGEFTKTAVTSQDITISLVLNSSQCAQGVTVEVADIPKGAIGSCFTLPDNSVYIDGYTNNTNPNISWPLSSIRIVMSVGSASDLDAIQWNPLLAYEVKDASGQTYYEEKAVQDPMPYEANIMDGKIVAKTIIRNLHVQPHFEVRAGVATNAQFVLTVKTYGTLMGKGVFNVSTTGQETQNKVFGSPVLVSDFEVYPAQENLFFECFSRDYQDVTFSAADLFEHSIYYQIPLPVVGIWQNDSDFSQCNVTNNQYFPYGPLFEDMFLNQVFPSAYRGWAVAVVNGNPPNLSSYSGDPCSDGIKRFMSPGMLDKGVLDHGTDGKGNFPMNENIFVMLENYDGNPNDYQNWTAGPNVQYIVQPYQFYPNSLTFAYDEWHPFNNTDNYNTSNAYSSSRAAQKYIMPICMQSGKTLSIIRESDGTQTCQGWSNQSISIIPGLSISGNQVTGYNENTCDYIDMNGDGFPDIIMNGTIHYTNPNGGIGNKTATPPPLHNNINHEETTSTGAGLTFDPALAAADAQGTSGQKGGNPPTSNILGEAISKVSNVSVNGSVGESYNDTELIDMNGDGLPDRVVYSGGNLLVYYNTGYGFATQAVTWTIPGGGYSNEVDSYTLGVGIGISGILNIGGGYTESGAKYSLADVNGDGLPDLIDQYGNVAFNTGSGFTPFTTVGLYGDGEKACGIALANQDSYGQSDAFNISTSFSGSAALAWGWNLLGTQFNLGLNFQAQAVPFENTMSKQTQMIIDVDGDGLPDEVISSTGNNDFRVAYNTVGRTNLLQSATRPMGSVINLNYTRAQKTMDMPQSKWNMISLVVQDGINNNTGYQYNGGINNDSTSLYAYSTGKYYKFYREFMGYAYVSETDTVNNNVPPPYNQKFIYRTYDVASSDISTDSSLSNHYFMKGQLLDEKVMDGSGVLHYEKANQFTWTGVYSENEENNFYPSPSLLSSDTYYDWYDNNISCFPVLQSTTENFYENGNGPVTRSFTYVYDYAGNITSYTDTGSENNDSASATVAYLGGPYSNSFSFVNSVPPVLGPINLPTDITVSMGGNTARKRHADYELSNWNLIDVKEYTDSSGDYNQTSMTYYPPNPAMGYPAGNIASITMPPANLPAGPSEMFTYTYDAFSIYINKITDTNGDATSIDYDYSWGKPLNITDENGNQMSYAYDTCGRLASVTGPNETAASPYAVTYQYHPEATVPYAITYNRDQTAFGYDNSPIEIITFTDGLGRIIQTKKDAAVAESNFTQFDNDMVVSGRVFFDNIGNVLSQYYPSTEAKGANNNNTGFTTPPDPTGVPPTQFTYDAFNRTQSITFPDQTTQSFSYVLSNTTGKGAGTNNRLETIVTDYYGNKKSTYKDSKQQIMEVDEAALNPAPVFPDTSPHVTAYIYDSLGEMTQVTDNKGNNTNIVYDMLGRKIYIKNPDTGAMTWIYDQASNMAAKSTSNLGLSQFITYVYDNCNRLTFVHYPTGLNQANDITYVYGGQGSTGNTIGRISSVSYGAGSQAFTYDGLGNVTQEIDTIKEHGTTGSQQFIFTFKWDDLGRMLTMTYPDGEGLIYNYYGSGGGGLLFSISNQSYTTTYINGILYDKFGSRVAIYRGNSIADAYTYYPNTHRLWTKTTWNINNSRQPGSGTPLQALSYQYDNVGNITWVQNQMYETFANPTPSPTPASPLQTVVRTFAYDGFYRLTGSTGNLYDSGNAEIRNYGLTTTYDSIHNILSKYQTVVNNPAGQPTPSQPSYSFTYVYSATKPHQIANITDMYPTPVATRTYGYDNNGNMTWVSFQPAGNNITMSWDEENRMMTWVTNPSAIAEYYWYNEAGNRVDKMDPGSSNPCETLYPNQFCSLWVGDTSGAGVMYTKNYYAGNERVASALFNDMYSNSQPIGTYYYHTDHLGSTTYMTDTNGVIQEHIEYTPWGEQWGNTENALTWANLNYKFTGKELDTTSNLYYYGARYYDPQISMWISADPALPDYLSSLVGRGGIFNPMTLALYSYGQNDPIIYSDPDGRMAEIVAPVLIGGALLIIAAEEVANKDKPVPNLPSTTLTFPEMVLKNYMDSLLPLAKLLGAGDSGQAKENKENSNTSADQPNTAPPPPAQGDKNNKNNNGNKNKKEVRTEPKNLKEQLTKEEAESGQGKKIMDKSEIKDPKYEGKYDKYSNSHKYADGTQTEYHYMKNSEGEIRDGKFIDPGDKK